MQCFGAHKLCFILDIYNWWVWTGLFYQQFRCLCQAFRSLLTARKRIATQELLVTNRSYPDRILTTKNKTKKNFQTYAMIDVWTSNCNKDVFEVAWILHCNPAIDMSHIWESWSPCFLSVLLSELLLYEEFESKAFTGDTRNSVCHFAPVVDKLSRDLTGTKGHRDLIARSTWIMKNREHSTLISKFTKR